MSGFLLLPLDNHAAVTTGQSPSGTLGRSPQAETGRAPAAETGRFPTTPPSNILRSVYFLFLGFVGIAALFALTMGGVLWMFSSSLTSTEQARKWISNAIWGLIIAALSFLLLRTINEDLVRDFNIEGVIKGATGIK